VRGWCLRARANAICLICLQKFNSLEWPRRHRIEEAEQEVAEKKAADMGVPGNFAHAAADQWQAEGDEDIPEEPERGEHHDRTVAQRAHDRLPRVEMPVRPV